MPRDTPVIHPGWASSVDDVLEQTRPTEVRVERPNLSSNDRGGQTEGEPTVVATVMARISSLFGGRAEAEAAGRLTGTGSWVVALPAGTDVRAQDYIVTTAAPVRRFQVTPPVGGSSNETERRVFATEVG